MIEAMSQVAEETLQAMKSRRRQSQESIVIASQVVKKVSAHVFKKGDNNMTPQEIRYECIRLSVSRSSTGMVDGKTAEQIVADAQKFEDFINGPTTGCGSAGLSFQEPRAL